MSVVSVVQSMPSELQSPMLEFAKALEEKIHADLAVRREDIVELGTKVEKLEAVQQQTVGQVNRLEAAIARLAEAQLRTEERLDRLEQTVAELAEAQRRTEAQTERLTEAQRLANQRIAELAEAQRRTEERMDRLEQAMAELAEAQRHTEEQVQQLIEAQRRTEERMDRLEQAMAELAEAQRRTEEQVQQLIEAQRRTEEQVQQLIEAQRRTEETLRYHSKRLDGLIGDNLERRYRERAFSFFGPILWPVRNVPLEEVLPGLEDQLTEKEFSDLLQLDVLLHGRARAVEGRPEVWIALEVSAKVDRNDVERAVRRAQILSKAGMLTVPAVAGEAITEGANTLAAQRAALVLQNGRRLNWPQALEAALARQAGASTSIN